MSPLQPLVSSTSAPAPGLARYRDVLELVARETPSEPLHCLYPALLREKARRFLTGFPGRVLYAVKANPDPRVLLELWQAGVRDFDTASLPEIELVKNLLPAARCHFMTPLRLPGAAAAAFSRHGLRHFVVDHPDGLDQLLSEVGPMTGLSAPDLTVFVRMAAGGADAAFDLSAKFGASPALTVQLLRRLAECGIQAALAFNVGSLVMRPRAYEAGLELAREILAEADLTPRVIDLGGGFPTPYPGLATAPLPDFFAAIERARATLPLASGGEIWGEPGRALVAEGMSLLTRVLLAKQEAVYLNDGLYGGLNEVALSGGAIRLPYRHIRPGEAGAANERDFRVFGPTCDSEDRLPLPWRLPADLRRGDWLEFGMAGAYSVSVRSNFNGFGGGQVVTIAGEDAAPPA